MDMDTFVIQLAAAAPSVSELTKSGLTDGAADEFIKSFIGVKRDPCMAGTSQSGRLPALEKWDLTRVEIGMVRFPEPPIDYSGAGYIGCVESDPLIAQPESSEIVVQEINSPGHILWRVANDLSKLLAALVIAARFLAQRAVRNVDADDCESARSVAMQCASAAGGRVYLDFYSMLLGAE